MVYIQVMKNYNTYLSNL